MLRRLPVTLLAGLAIFPIVFANGLSPAEGPGLIFATLPVAFGQMPGGAILGPMFFVLMAIAALTSAIIILEAKKTKMQDRIRALRTSTCRASMVVFLVASILLQFAQAEWTDLTTFSVSVTIEGLLSCVLALRDIGS